MSSDTSIEKFSDKTIVRKSVHKSLLSFSGFTNKARMFLLANTAAIPFIFGIDGGFTMMLASTTTYGILTLGQRVVHNNDMKKINSQLLKGEEWANITGKVFALKESRQLISHGSYYHKGDNPDAPSLKITQLEESQVNAPYQIDNYLVKSYKGTSVEQVITPNPLWIWDQAFDSIAGTNTQNRSPHADTEFGLVQKMLQGYDNLVGNDNVNVKREKIARVADSIIGEIKALKANAEANQKSIETDTKRYAKRVEKEVENYRKRKKLEYDSEAIKALKKKYEN